MVNFIKNIAENNIDEWTHNKFVRYSLGEFKKEEFTITKGSNFIQIKAGVEYLDVILKLMAELVKEPVSLNGIIVSAKDISQELDKLGIEPLKVTGKKYTIEEELAPEKFKEFVEKLAEKTNLLLKLKSDKYSLSVKKSVPKPGKLVEKFLSAKFDLNDYDKLKEEFLFDAGDFKKAVIINTYIITEIEIPKEFENDPALARLKAKRVGKIIRNINIDGKEETKEYELNV